MTWNEKQQATAKRATQTRNTPSPCDTRTQPNGSTLASPETTVDRSPIVAHADVWRKLMAANRELDRLLDHARMLGVDLGDVPDTGTRHGVDPSG